MIEKLDHQLLDGRTLALFLLVIESGSFSKAAAAMNMNQSAVSYAMDRLRLIVGDPLFVKSGRNIAATPRALELAPRAKQLLAELERFTQTPNYDPAQDEGEFVIAANDYEVEVVLSPLLRKLQSAAPLSRLRLMQPKSQGEWGKLLRENVADLVLAPTLLSNEADLVQSTIFRDSTVCYFDSAKREAPASLKAYCEAPHIVVSLDRNTTSEVDDLLGKIGRKRRVSVFLPSFTSVPMMMKGTTLVATLPALMQHNIFKGFKSCKVPFEFPNFSVAQIWHARNNMSPRHRWLRSQIDGVSKRLARS